MNEWMKKIHFKKKNKRKKPKNYLHGVIIKNAMNSLQKKKAKK